MAGGVGEDDLKPPNFDGIVGRMYADSKQLVPVTVRIPRELRNELKRRSIRSTDQLLAEHAYLLYVRQRLPRRFTFPFLWPDPFAKQPKPAYLDSPLHSKTVRIPRGLLRWAKVFAAEEELSDQQLALRVFDTYVRWNRYPPNKEDVKRDRLGFLVVEEPLVGRPFYEATDTEIKAAFKAFETEAFRLYRKASGLPDNPEDHGGFEIDFFAPDEEWNRRIRVKRERGKTGHRPDVSGVLQKQRRGDRVRPSRSRPTRERR